MTTTSQKLEVFDSDREFQERWTGQYFFEQDKNKPICLICKTSGFTLQKRLYDTRYEFSEVEGCNEILASEVSC